MQQHLTEPAARPNHHIRQCGQLVLVRFEAPPTLEDLMDATDEVALISETLPRLWDLRCGFDLATVELETLSAYAAARFREASVMAIVANNNLSFGLSRMFLAMRQGSPVRMSVFRDVDEALDWLKRESPVASQSEPA